MKFLYCLIAFVFCSSVYAQDWQKIHDTIKKDSEKSVRVHLVNVETTPKKSLFGVYFVDGKNEEMVGFVAFYGTDKASFLLDLTPEIRKISKPPSKEAKIILKPLKPNVKITCEEIKVEVVGPRE